MAFRHELCDTHGTYKGTFVTDTERWQIGDDFTDGDGRALRITDIAAPEHFSQRASESTQSPSTPPKIPYSCCSRTTSTSSRPSIRAVRT